MNKNISQTCFLNLLDIENDDSLIIDEISSDGGNKNIVISKRPSVVFCPDCGFRMHSKGLYPRKVNHPIFQDQSNTTIIVKQRKWNCPHCNKYQNEEFPFLQRYSHHSNVTPLLILEAMKDLNASTASIARRFNMSDTEVHDIFSRYVNLPRLPLSEFISVDEVYLNINHKRKYAFVIIDFVTGQIIDIVPDRYRNTLENYFYAIPLEERKKVKGIISDMYSAYLEMPQKFFPNAVSIIDSFHMTQALIQKLNNYINDTMRRYKDIDLRRLEEKNLKNNQNNKTIKESKEVALLRKYRWVLLKNDDDINYSHHQHWHAALHMYADTYLIEKEFMSLDKNFQELKRLKEMFISLNHRHFKDVNQALKNIDALVELYKASNQKVFKEFADFLKDHRIAFAYSFIQVKVIRSTINDKKNYYSRLNNSYMESMNRKPKDYRRITRGSSQFDYTRNRILWATRINPPILGIPKSYEMIHSYKGKKRGHYNKKK